MCKTELYRYCVQQFKCKSRVIFLQRKLVQLLVYISFIYHVRIVVVFNVYEKFKRIIVQASPC